MCNPSGGSATNITIPYVEAVTGNVVVLLKWAAHILHFALYI